MQGCQRFAEQAGSPYPAFSDPRLPGRAPPGSDILAGQMNDPVYSGQLRRIEYAVYRIPRDRSRNGRAPSQPRHSVADPGEAGQQFGAYQTARSSDQQVNSGLRC